MVAAVLIILVHVLVYVLLLLIIPFLIGTQRVISFLRQIVEHGGFYRTSDQTWIHLERIQFVGACNPPTDPGRKPLTHRLAALSPFRTRGTPY